MRYTNVLACIAIAAVAIDLTGCATAGKSMRPAIPNPQTSSSVRDYTRQLCRALTTPQIALWQSIIPTPHGPGNDTTDDAVETWDFTWGKEARAYSPRVRDDFQVMCKVRGGIWESPFCQTAGDPDRVLFYAIVKPHNGPDPADDEVGFQIIAIEPKPGHETSLGYVNLLRAKAGFMTQSDIAVAAARRQQQEAAARADVARAIAEQPQVRTVGSKICRVGGNLVTTGYVERVAGDKIQIRVVNVSYINAPDVHPGGSSGDHIIWDVPERWRLCE